MKLTEDQSQRLLAVAKEAIVHALRDEDPPPIETDDPALLQPAGCFVSLHAQHTHLLRGCVGRMGATQPLLQCVRETAAGVLEDPRFLDRPVNLGELSSLEIEISVLSPLHPVEDPLSFDLLNDGIYLSYRGRSGVFLPQVARETGWTREQLLDRLCTEKLGVPARAWRSAEARLSVFSTLIVGPVPF